MTTTKVPTMSDKNPTANVPAIKNEDYLIALDQIREEASLLFHEASFLFSCRVLRRIYPELTERTAADIVSIWIQTYSQRHSQG